MFSIFRQYFRLSSINFFFLLLTIFCIPLLYIPAFRSVWDLPKELALYTFLSIIFVLSLFEIVKTKKLRQKRTVLDKPFVVLLCAGLFSTLFSKNPSLSFWGIGDAFVLHFFAIFLFVAWAWILIQKIESEKLFHQALFVFFLSGIFSSIIFLSFEFSHFFGSQIINPVAKLNSVFGIYMVSLFTLSLGSLVPSIKQKGSYFVISLLCVVMTLLTLFRLDFQILWVLLAFGMGLLFLVSMAFWGAVRKSVLLCTFSLFLFSLFHLLLPNVLNFGRALPSEINLNPAMSGSIIASVLSINPQNFLLGSGPGTFMYNFSLFRPGELNQSSYFWSLRFDSPWSSLYSWLCEFGFLGSLSLLFILLLIFGSVLSAVLHIRSSFWKRARFSFEKIRATDSSLEYFVCMIAWFLLTCGIIISVYNFALWFVWWTMLAFVVLGLSYIQPNLVKESEKTFEISPQYVFVVSFFFLLLSAATVFGGVMWGKIAVAEYFVAHSDVHSALKIRPQSSEYLLLLARESLQDSLSFVSTDPNRAAELLSSAIDFASRAREIDPNNVRVFEILSTAYLQTLPYTNELSLQQSLLYATDAVTHALQLEPNNPVFVSQLGLIQEFSSQFDLAEKSYKKAISFKSDYVQAYFDLARLYEKQNKTDAAISLYEEYRVIDPQSRDVLYELGRLYYNRKHEGDEKRAEKIWLLSVQIDPNFSNALYSLGLLYEKKGEYALAVEYFKKVHTLNPENKDVDKKLKSLSF
jgi:tetratricopeptide (TPR) repeat protein